TRQPPFAADKIEQDREDDKRYHTEKVGVWAFPKRITLLRPFAKAVLDRAERRQKGEYRKQYTRDSGARDVARGNEYAVRLIGLSDDLLRRKILTGKLAFQIFIYEPPNNSAHENRRRGRNGQID